jgi:hypothetical protein
LFLASPHQLTLFLFPFSDVLDSKTQSSAKNKQEWGFLLTPKAQPQLCWFLLCSYQHPVRLVHRWIDENATVLGDEIIVQPGKKEPTLMDVLQVGL